MKNLDDLIERLEYDLGIGGYNINGSPHYYAKWNKDYSITPVPADENAVMSQQTLDMMLADILRDEDRKILASLTAMGHIGMTTKSPTLPVRLAGS